MEDLLNKKKPSEANDPNIAANGNGMSSLEVLMNLHNENLSQQHKIHHWLLAYTPCDSESW